ncbi:MAG: hypothetical protein WCJ03_09300 [Bacteroidales bacterium]
MKIKCILGFHTWKGCKCTNCHKTRNEQHDWKSGNCLNCGKSNKREVIKGNINDRPIAIDPKSITYAFVVLCHEDNRYSDKLFGSIADFNRLNQPKLWNTHFNVKFISLLAEKGDSGYPSADSTIIALEHLGMEPHSSIVINIMLISLDGGKTETKIQNGFVFRDDNPRVFIVPRKDFIIPKEEKMQ